MNIEAMSFLQLVEQANKICTFDIEATGLRGDYNSVLCVSIRPVGGKATTFSITKPGNDRMVVLAASRMLASYDCWVSYYGKGFDIPMLNTRLLKWGLPPIEKRPHIDMYYTLKFSLNTSRRSQGHLLTWLGINEKGEASSGPDGVQKMSVGADEWNKILSNPSKVMPTMVARCESDTLGLQALYLRTKHLIRDIKK